MRVELVKGETKISSAVLSLRRQITSSRQSPRMSPLSEGVLLLPLFDDAFGAKPCVPPVAGSRSKFCRPWVVLFQSLIVVPSTSSRYRSPSHHAPKFVNMLPGLGAMMVPSAA